MVAQVPAPMLVMVALPVAESDSARGREYSMLTGSALDGQDLQQAQDHILGRGPSRSQYRLSGMVSRLTVNPPPK